MCASIFCAVRDLIVFSLIKKLSRGHFHRVTWVVTCVVTRVTCYFSEVTRASRAILAKSHAFSLGALGNTPDFWVHQKWHIFKKGKLVSTRSRLYDQLRRRPNSRFSQNMLHSINKRSKNASGNRFAQKINVFRKSQNRRPQPGLRRKLPESQKYPRTPRARARVRKTKVPRRT